MDAMRATERLWHRMRHMIRIGRITGSDDSKNAQIVQVKLSALEQRDHTRMLTLYGIASRPLTDSDVVVLFIGGDRSAGVGIATSHQTKRLKNLKEGEVALYDDLERKIHLTRDGIVVRGKDHDINVQTDAKVIIIAPTIELKADDETLRKLVTEAFKDIYNEHQHGSSGPPSPQMTDAHLTGALRGGGPA